MDQFTAWKAWQAAEDNACEVEAWVGAERAAAAWKQAEEAQACWGRMVERETARRAA